MKQVIVENWGSLPYREAWERQKSAFEALIASPDSPSHIYMVEHLAVYTLGVHGKAENLLASEARLKAIGAECIRTERGGDITFHGPGQLVVYPVINLHTFGLGVKKYVELLENSVIQLLASYGVAATCNSEAIGVWIDWGKPLARKICAIGVKISHGVTMHGLALNLNTDLEAFRLINPCGITDKDVTSLERELGHKIDMEEAASKLAEIMLTKLNTI